MPLTILKPTGLTTKNRSLNSTTWITQAALKTILECNTDQCFNPLFAVFKLKLFHTLYVKRNLGRKTIYNEAIPFFFHILKKSVLRMPKLFTFYRFYPNTFGVTPIQCGTFDTVNLRKATKLRPLSCHSCHSFQKPKFRTDTSFWINVCFGFFFFIPFKLVVPSLPGDNSRDSHKHWQSP